LPIATGPASSFSSSAANQPASSEHDHESSSSSSTAAASRVQVQDLDELRATANLGQGASGVVQRVLHVPSGVALALKVVNVTLDAAQNEKKVRHLITELRTLHLSACPNIVSFHGAFYKEGAVYLCLEYMDFGSLADLLKMAPPLPLSDSSGGGPSAAVAEDEDASFAAAAAGGPGCIPERLIAIIARHVLVGLVYLHNVRRLIHRDIKPSNLLLNSRGQCKIADFGVSGQIENETMDAKSSFVGTVTYMSVRACACFCRISMQA
jgi:serine/threonine protein kinase